MDLSADNSAPSGVLAALRLFSQPTKETKEKESKQPENKHGTKPAASAPKAKATGNGGSAEGKGGKDKAGAKRDSPSSASRKPGADPGVFGKEWHQPLARVIYAFHSRDEEVRRLAKKLLSTIW
jgi:hypothetical protein